jgi:antitoxin ParD1/3/4
VRLAKFANEYQRTLEPTMSTMNISLPDSMKSFVDEQVSQRGYGTSSEYLRDLIRRDQDRQHLRGLLLAGASAPVVQEATPEYFSALRQQVRAKAGAVAKPARSPRKGT